tara:strand:- start:247 stop:1968 length:1722 start_codon:yes stop_codon:yes gene_type:complete
MEVSNCTDINGVALNEISFNADGTVVGVLDVDGGQIDTNLSYDCCVAQGYTFDPTDTKCYWTDSCLVGGEYKIILDPEGSSGALFQIDEDQNCILELEIDYLLKFNCNDVTTSLKSILENLHLKLSIEKVIIDNTLPIPNNLETVYYEDLFLEPDLGLFFASSGNTGIMLEGSENSCEAVIQNLIQDLGPNDSLALTSSSLYSDWVKYRITITDPVILESISNERLKVGIIGNSLTNYSIVVDDAKLIRNCDDELPVQFLNSECPSFNLSRVIDNKKSWVHNETTELRNFDLSRRETNYNINSEKLSINTKEIDLLINPSLAIENDVLNFVGENQCILEPAESCTTGATVTSHECVDISALLTTPVDEVTNGTELINQLIDVKSRKTINSYPTIDLLYHRYLNSAEHCSGTTGNALDESSVNTFVDLIGGFWSDLIEQVVPATTIWGSSFQKGNNIFGSSSTNKFNYRKNTLVLCDTKSGEYPSPTSGIESGVIVKTQDITGYNEPIVPVDTISITPPPISTCSTVSINQINDGSEFLGVVTILGEPGGPTTGSTITITETITDDCDKIGPNC